MVGRDGHTCLHRTAVLRTAVKIRSDFIDGVHHSHHGSGSVEAVHVVSPPRRMDGLDGLSSLRMIFKVTSCDNRLRNIDTGRVVIGNVSGSHQLVRVLHEVITVSILGCRLGESSAE